MKRVLCGLAAVWVSFAASAQGPVGLWKTIDDATKKDRAYVRITESGGVLNGKLEKLIETPDADKLVCDKCTDDRKGQPIEGLQIVRGVKQNAEEPTRWDGGTILDPNNGKTYKVRLTPIDDGKKLEVRGYFGAPMFGRTQTWVRAE